MSNALGKAYGPDEESARAHIRTYENKDPRCTYPFTCDPLGYCWSFANHVDGEEKFKDIEQICPGCECWKENVGNDD